MKDFANNGIEELDFTTNFVANDIIIQQKKENLINSIKINDMRQLFLI